MGILPLMHPNVPIAVNQAEVSMITVIGNSSVPSSYPALSDSRYGVEIAEWFRSHPEICLVSCDGSMSYEAIVTEALPRVCQVSDRFHLMKNLRETMVEGIWKHLGKPDVRQPYPYPTQEDAG